MKNAEIISWGKSMYGGYYVDMFIDGKVIGFGAKTLKALKEKIKDYNITLSKNSRKDN